MINLPVMATGVEVAVEISAMKVLHVAIGASVVKELQVAMVAANVAVIAGAVKLVGVAAALFFLWLLLRRTNFW